MLIFLASIDSQKQAVEGLVKNWETKSNILNLVQKPFQMVSAKAESKRFGLINEGNAKLAAKN